MSDSKLQILALVAVALVITGFTGGAWAQAPTPKDTWPTYHYDSQRGGQNENSLDISNPASLNIIWAWPRGTGFTVAEEKTIVDNLSGFFSGPVILPTLPVFPTATDHFGTDFVAMPAVSKFDTNPIYTDAYRNASVATWKFPVSFPVPPTGPELPPGKYQIMIWVPSSYAQTNTQEKPLYQNTSKAEYTVYDANGATTITFDQRNGGSWRLLSDRQFNFEGSGAFRVELSSFTGDAIDELIDPSDCEKPVDCTTTIVAVDAIKFVAGKAGGEVFASPASAIIKWGCDWTFTWKDPNNILPDENYNGTFSPKDIPVVYVGNVESPLSTGEKAPDSGSVHCVNSITPTLRRIKDDLFRTGEPASWAEANGLALFLGTDVWKYPRDANERIVGSTVSGINVPLNDIEGPIEGGIYASPSVVNDTAGKPVVYVAGMDRQVYAFNGTTGDLLWKGPGVTLSEDGPGGVPPAGWIQISPRRDAFGGKFSYVDATAANRSPAAWLFTDAKRKAAGEPDTPVGSGWSYSVYAWIPVRQPGDPERIKNAKYTITYQGNSSEATARITVDQSDINKQGCWTKLGGSYFNVSKVQLSPDHVDAIPPTPTTPAIPIRCAVADAVMIVPNTIGAFGYCTPVGVTKDVSGPCEGIYAANQNGRILRFGLEVASVDVTAADRIGKVQWIFPAVRSKLRVSGEADADQPSMGQLAASPAYYAEKLYVADFDGHVRCITNLDADKLTTDPALLTKQVWRYPDNDDDELAPFSSSPAIDTAYNSTTPQLLIGDTNGQFLSIRCSETQLPDEQQLNWKYPKGNGLPLGAFRYSSPAVATDSAIMRRAWIASTDGHIYSFYVGGEPTDPNVVDRRLWVEYHYDANGNIIGQTQHGDAFYLEPTVFAPMQASVALDGQLQMFVGDMREQGVLHWFDARTGSSEWRYPPTSGNVYKGYTTQGQLFSSPNITRTFVGSSPVSYIFNGGGDGRVYAWSDEGGAWGGSWSGGKWPFQGTEDDQNQNKEQQFNATEVDIQFDIFKEDYYKASGINNPEPSGNLFTVPITTATWGDNWIVSKEMKQPTNLDLSGKTGKVLDDEIDKKLLVNAKTRRKDVFPSASKRCVSDPEIYFEWGEKINVILWNLPALQFLHGDSPSAKQNNIRFVFANASPSASAGSMMSFNAKALREYTVIQSAGTTTTAGTTYPPVEYERTDPIVPNPVRRCYALGELIINKPGIPPPPGPGWVLTAELKRKSSSASTASITQNTIPIARLRSGGSGAPDLVTVPAGVSSTTMSNYKEQLLGINNPLAIRDDNVANIAAYPHGLAWPILTSFKTNREDPTAHFNGNAIYDKDKRTYSDRDRPVMNVDKFRGQVDLYGNTIEGVSHGTSSRQGKLGVMDRSATGTNTYPGSGVPPNNLRQAVLENFRINPGNLGWRGGDDAIRDSMKVDGRSCGVKFPWELGIGSADYPGIQIRNQSYRKHSDDKDPSLVSTSLPPVRMPLDASNNYITDYDQAIMRPDAVYVSVDVPKYQPANMNGGNSESEFGYSKSMYAFIDSNRNGIYDSGNQIVGRPSTYQETYRKFRVGLRVPPDPKIEVDEQGVDIGRVAHGLGEGLDFVAVNPAPEVQRLFKKITIRNAGNVNLYNIGIGGAYAKLFAFRDQSTPPIAPGKSSEGIRQVSSDVPSISGTEITSSLDRFVGGYPGDMLLQNLMIPPFTTAMGAGSFVNGYTLTKPRVGDSDPTILTIPDQRKWDANYQGTQTIATNAWVAACTDMRYNASPGMLTALPRPTEVSIRVPISKPIGTYQTSPWVLWDPDNSNVIAPAVPVWCDLNYNGVWDWNTNPPEPMASPTFHLKVTVKETVLTGGRAAASLLQIEEPLESGDYPKVGDATPAAFRDSVSGNIYLFWSSNRMPDMSMYPLQPGGAWVTPDDPQNAAYANAPWLIYRTALKWDNQRDLWLWQQYVNSRNNKDLRWWEVPPMGSNPYLPSTTVQQWPDPITTGAGDKVMEWKPGYKSVRHFAPSLAEIPYDPKSPNAARTWMAWAGAANVLGGDGKVFLENRLFYSDVTNGDVTRTVVASANDPSTEKRSPSLSIFDNTMWMFWQAGEKGRWSILYSTNNDAANSFPGTNWKPDAELKVPDCLASVGSPNAVHRIVGDVPTSNKSKNMFDVVYSGSSKLNPTPDVLLTKYPAVTSGAVPQPLPRVYAEKLQRDAKYGFFTSEHLAWMRPSRSGYDKLVSKYAANVTDILTDHMGQQEHMLFEGRYDALIFKTKISLNIGLYEFYNLPHIWVDLPAGYEISAGNTTTATSTLVSATSGIVPNVDEATGLVVYEYKDGTDAKNVFGKMIADFSAGIVRFTNPLKEVKAGDEVRTPQVLADYTPQTWRLTTSSAVDNSPRAFIERTGMLRYSNNATYDTNPGLGDKWAVPRINEQGARPSVDRLWAMWRRAGTGMESSTIFWKTYRIGVDLAKLGFPPIKWSKNGDIPYVNNSDIKISDNLGPWEVDRTGTRIYFTEVDERYSSLIKSGSQSVLGAGIPPFTTDESGDNIGDTIKPIIIEYTDRDNNRQTVNASEVSWLLESPERSLFGDLSESSVNEGSIYAFADLGAPNLRNPGTLKPFPASKIWVFWTSTRSGSSDMCWATISPNFTPK